MIPTPVPRCLECQSRLDADGVCLACAFRAALDSEHCPDNAPELGFSSILPAPLPGRFGKYEVRQQLGGGGMGVVWEAEDMQLRRTVALKMIRGFAFTTADEKFRFKTETEAVAQLDHPHIVPIFEVGEYAGQPFFTMKLIEGGSLSQRMRQGVMPTREAATLMLDVARAVHHAHLRGVLHRDLKPGNILLDHSGKPWLTDFGLAKLIGTESGVTVTEAQIGTPQYMSPEQAAGKMRELTTASDVWSLGAILYQLLAGRLPFEGATHLEIYHQINDHHPAPPSSISRTVDRDLATLVMCCLEKDPARRITSAGELADDLERWLAGEPIHARPASTWERAVKWSRRRPEVAALVVAFAVALMIGGIGIALQWRRAVQANTALDQANLNLTQANLRLNTELRISQARRLASHARTEVEQWPSLAALLAIASVETTRSVDGTVLDESFNALADVLNRLPGRKIGEAWHDQSVSLSASGRWLAAPKADGSVLLHDLSMMDGTAPPRTLAGSQKRVRYTAFSPDDRQLATVAEGATVVRWWSWHDDGSAPEVREVARHEKPISVLSFTPDGRWLLTAAGDGALLLTPTFPGGTPIRVQGSWQRPVDAVFSTLRSSVILMESNGAGPWWVDLDLAAGTGSARVLRTPHAQPSHVCALSPDGRWLATRDKSVACALFDLQAPDPEASAFLWATDLGGSNAMGEGLHFSPDSQWLAVDHGASVVPVWHLPTMQRGEPPLLYTGSPTANTATFSPDSRWLIMGSFDKTLYLWPLDRSSRRVEPVKMRGTDVTLRGLASGRNGVILGMGNSMGVGLPHTLWLWRFDGVTHREMPRLSKSLDGYASILGMDHRGKVLAAGVGANVALLDATSRAPQLRQQLSGTRGLITGLAFSNDDRRLWASSADGAVQAWDFSDGDAPPVHQLWKPPRNEATGERAQYLDLALHPDGRRLFFPTDRRTIEAWDFSQTDPAASRVIWPVEFPVERLRISPDGRWLVGGAIGYRFRSMLWDLSRPGSPPRTIAADPWGGAGFDFSPDSQWLAITGLNVQAQVWDLHDPPDAPPRFVSARMGGNIRRPSFSPDGRTLALPLWNGTVRLWEFARDDGGSARTLPVGGTSGIVAWHPGGHQIFSTGGNSGRVAVSDIHIEPLLIYARRLAGRDFTAEERSRFALPKAEAASQ